MEVNAIHFPMYPVAGTRLAVMGRLLDMMLWSSKRHKRERDDQEKKNKNRKRKPNKERGIKGRNGMETFKTISF